MNARDKDALSSTGAIALYIGIASVLKTRILRREWPTGTKVPTVEELSERYGVARATARQALQLLVSEKLIASQRGRGTFVTYSEIPSPHVSADILGAVSAAEPDHSITIIERTPRVLLPAPFMVRGHAADSYMRIRKTHSVGGVAYGYFEIFIAHDVYDRFPPGADEREKLAWLMMQHRVAVLYGIERLSIHAADIEEARYLRCNLADPTARMLRVMVGAGERIVYASNNIYRGSMFTQEREITSYLRAPDTDSPPSSGTLSGPATPIARSAKRKKKRRVQLGE
jgi:GntR family transcriptional regulator